MQYHKVISSERYLHRKWCKFLVGNGLVTPSKYFLGTVPPKEARKMKKLSVCNGSGTQYDYNAKTGLISGFFRDSNFESLSDFSKLKTKELFKDTLISGKRKKILAELRIEKKQWYRKIMPEILLTRRIWLDLDRERKLLMSLENALRVENGRRAINSFMILSISKRRDRMFGPMDLIIDLAKRDLHELYFLQIKTLQKLISKKSIINQPT